MGVESLITLIIIILLVLLALRWAVGEQRISQKAVNIVLLVVAIVVLLWLLQRYGGL